MEKLAQPFAVRPAATVAEVLQLWHWRRVWREAERDIPLSASGRRWSAYSKRLTCVRHRLGRTSPALLEAARFAQRLTS